MRLERGDAVGLARALVQVDTRNPSLVPGGPGEAEAARLLAGVLEAWGLAVELQEAVSGRPNVIARAGTPGGRSLMYNGHLDVVGVEGMRHAPFAAEERGGRIYGRGAADMKAGVAAMCAAAALAADGLTRGELIVAAVVDEEFESLGTRALLDRGVRADAAIVTEPTGLAIMPAHRGFVWATLTFHGRAAHGSRWELGVDAIRHAGLVLAELDALDAGELARHTHPLAGRASVHASLVSGGTGMSTYPDRCELRIERRTVPGETPAQVMAELEAACQRVRARRPDLRVEVALDLARSPSDVPPNAPVVRALRDALDHQAIPVRTDGMSAWTDSALFNEAGVPAVCFGPGDIALAHSDEEFVDVEQIPRAAAVLERLARGWCGTGVESAWRR
ncbi:MAG: ArgE/DapE family deacylase [Gemmatimonadota bacterium]|nr:ArgE/DapE family deacylase [Gemmatimonadota bacterium]MDE3128285.1 ArgE/DapE family deacylase [Gemmatimonadota bacterium]MDE3173529.1 ArgE/DapE family deacylase [Gemmatimonadota bacterium]MDE3215353.1 ArgE/DapE family deacylase [Gemmatimonadota bacterium]